MPGPLVREPLESPYQVQPVVDRAALTHRCQPSSWSHTLGPTFERATTRNDAKRRQARFILLELYIQVRTAVLALLRVVAKPPTRISGFGVRVPGGAHQPRSGHCPGLLHLSSAPFTHLFPLGGRRPNDPVGRSSAPAGVVGPLQEVPGSSSESSASRDCPSHRTALFCAISSDSLAAETLSGGQLLTSEA
jgi:hypothetical protein